MILINPQGILIEDGKIIFTLGLVIVALIAFYIFAVSKKVQGSYEETISTTYITNGGSNSLTTGTVSLDVSSYFSSSVPTDVVFSLYIATTWRTNSYDPLGSGNSVGVSNIKLIG